MNLKTVYIAGKITGDKNYKAKFEDTKAELEKQGYIALTPSVLPSEGFEYGAYIRISGAMLRECEYIYLLPDWRDSAGAKAEYNIAKMLGIKVLNGGNYESS